MHRVIAGDIGVDLAPALALVDDVLDDLVIIAVAVQQVFVAAGHHLGGIELSQQLQRDVFVNEAVAGGGKGDQLVAAVHIRVDLGQVLPVKIVEHIRQGGQQFVLAVEVVVKGAAAGAGGFDDVADGGVLVALAAEKLPGGFGDTAAGLITVAHFFFLFALFAIEKSSEPL